MFGDIWGMRVFDAVLPMLAIIQYFRGLSDSQVEWDTAMGSVTVSITILRSDAIGPREPMREEEFECENRTLCVDAGHTCHT